MKRYDFFLHSLILFYKLSRIDVYGQLSKLKGILMNDFHCFKNNSISVALQKFVSSPKTIFAFTKFNSERQHERTAWVYIHYQFLNQGLWETRCFLFVRFNKTYLHCFQFCVSKRQVTCPQHAVFPCVLLKPPVHIDPKRGPWVRHY